LPGWAWVAITLGVIAILAAAYALGRNRADRTHEPPYPPDGPAGDDPRYYDDPGYGRGDDPRYRDPPPRQ
jgi:hypothetical protein